MTAAAAAKHLAAVARTLQWADESAERGDYSDALAWLDTVEAVGDDLPEVYKIRRDSWSAHLAAAVHNRRNRPPAQPAGREAENPNRTIPAALDDLHEGAA